VDGAAEAGQAQRGAGLGEGRERGGIAAEAPGEEGSVEAEAVSVGARRGGELDEAVPVVQGGSSRRGRGGDVHAWRMAWRRASVSLAYTFRLPNAVFSKLTNRKNFGHVFEFYYII
jgi:hypothetical protein